MKVKVNNIVYMVEEGTTAGELLKIADAGKVDTLVQKMCGTIDRDPSYIVREGEEFLVKQANGYSV
jgi:hypothetical protein